MIAFVGLWIFSAEAFAVKWQVVSTYESGTAGFGADSQGTSTLACPNDMYLQSMVLTRKYAWNVVIGPTISPKINGITIKCVGLDSAGRLDFSNIAYRYWPDGGDHISPGNTWNSFWDRVSDEERSDMFVSTDLWPETTFMHGLEVSAPGRNKYIRSVKLRMRRFEPYDGGAVRVTVHNSPTWFATSTNWEESMESQEFDSVSCLPSGQNYNPDTNKIHVARGLKILHKDNPSTTPRTKHVRELKVLCAELKRSK